jgi:hypothetical protein
VGTQEELWFAFLNDMASAVTPGVGNAGMTLWQSLAVLMIVWTGTQMALAGRGLNMEAVVRLIITLSIPLGMLQFYVTPLYGGLNVPDLITGMGGWIQVQLSDPSVQQFNQGVMGLGTQIWQALTFTADPDAGTLARVAGFLDALLDLVIGVPMVVLLWVVNLLVSAFGLAQVIWGQFGLTVALMLGPIFIPWIVFPPLSFLFWGWLRTLLTFSFYSAVATAVYRVVTQVGNITLSRVTEINVFTAAGLEQLINDVAAGVAFGVAGLFASMKVGELTAMLMSGSGSVASSVGTRVTQVTRVVGR